MSSDKDRKLQCAIRYDQLRRQYKEKLNPKDWIGTMSLIYELDTPVCLITSDGETVIGELSSFDTYGNIILAKSRGRRFVSEFEVEDRQYGTCFFRAEEVMAIGSIDPDKEAEYFHQKNPQEQPSTE